MPSSDAYKTTRTLTEMARVVAPATPPTTGPLSLAPWVMELRVVGTPVTVQVNVKDHMLIGRADSERGIHPEIDLSEPEGMEKGVSRRHASIVIHDERLFIRDLGSTNGTQLNGMLCEPLKEYRLRHGDELMLGNMRLQVIFAVVPAKDMTATGFKRLEIPRVGKGERVLVVEDDRDVGAVVRMALEKAGFTAVLVPNVNGALQLTTSTLPKVVIVDMMLAEMNALDFVRHVRKQSGGAGVGIIVTSSATGGFQMHQALEAGADRFLGKPVALDELVRAVDSVRRRENAPAPEPSRAPAIQPTGQLPDVPAPTAAAPTVAKPDTSSKATSATTVVPPFFTAQPPTAPTPPAAPTPSPSEPPKKPIP